MSTALEDICKILNLVRRSQRRKRAPREEDHRHCAPGRAQCGSCVTATALSRFDRCAEPSANDCYLRNPAGRESTGAGHRGRRAAGRRAESSDRSLQQRPVL